MEDTGANVEINAEIALERNKKMLEGQVSKFLKSMNEDSSFVGYYDKDEFKLYVEFIGYEDTDFHNGQYIIEFTLCHKGGCFPLHPPMIKVLTESGRFDVNKHLSLSVSHFHPGTWIVMSIVALINCVSWVFSDYNVRGIGHLKANSDTVKNLALASREYNSKNYPKLSDFFECVHKLKETKDSEKLETLIKDMLD